MKKTLFFLILGTLFGGLFYGVYWYAKESLNPSWEKQAGLTIDYKTTFANEDILGAYSYKSKTGTMGLTLSQKNLYEISLERSGTTYLYSTGTWEKKIDESVFPERISYLLKSDKLNGKIGQFRFRFHEMRGNFFKPQNDTNRIEYYAHFPSEQDIYETWEFRIVENGLLDLKTNKTYLGIQSQKLAEEKKSTKNEIPKKVENPNSNPSNFNSEVSIEQGPILMKERHENAKIIPTNIAKIKNKIESVFDCEGCYGKMIVRLVLIQGMEFQIHIIEEGKEYLYSEGVYSGDKTIGLNALEIKQEYAAYRLDKHPYHGTFVNDPGGEEEMKAIRKIEEIWNAKSIFETWMFRKTENGNLLDINDKKTFIYNKELSKWNIAEI